MKRRRIIVVALLLAIAAAVFWYRERTKSSAEPPFFSGYGEGELVYVSSPIAGELEQLVVQRGDQVEKAAFLFELERGEERAARAEAEETLRESRARVDKATMDFTRAKSLRDKRVIAPEAYDTAQQDLLAAQHAAAARQRGLEQADWRFAQKQQSAPAGGLVYDTYFRPGEWISAGTPVLSILPPEYMKVRFFVPESELGRMQIGTPLEIRMDGLSRAPRRQSELRLSAGGVHSSHHLQPGEPRQIGLPGRGFAGAERCALASPRCPHRSAIEAN